MCWDRIGVNARLGACCLLLCLSGAVPAETVIPMGYVRAAEAAGLPALVAYSAALSHSSARVDNGCLQPWPWTVKIGRRLRHYARRSDAHAALVNALARPAVPVQVGLMQIDARSAGLAPADLLDPALNLTAGLRVFKQKHPRYPAATAAWLKRIERSGLASLCQPNKGIRTYDAAYPNKKRRPTAHITALVERLAPVYRLDPELVKAVIAQESGFNPYAQSGKRARGLMQLIPETQERFGVLDPYDPEDNIRGGSRYLNWLLRHFNGDVALTLAAYNAGEKAVERYQGIPPYAETRRYVGKIMAHYPRRRHPVPPPVS